MTEQLTKVKNYHEHLEKALRGLDVSAELIVQELKLEDKLLPRAAYTIGMYARAVYFELQNELNLPRQRTAGW